MTRVPMTDRLEKALETLLGRATPDELAYMVGTEEYRELQAAYREARAARHVRAGGQGDRGGEGDPCNHLFLSAL